MAILTPDIPNPLLIKAIEQVKTVGRVRTKITTADVLVILCSGMLTTMARRVHVKGSSQPAHNPTANIS